VVVEPEEVRELICLWSGLQSGKVLAELAAHSLTGWSPAEVGVVSPDGALRTPRVGQTDVGHVQNTAIIQFPLDGGDDSSALRSGLVPSSAQEASALPGPDPKRKSPTGAEWYPPSRVFSSASRPTRRPRSRRQAASSPRRFGSSSDLGGRPPGAAQSAESPNEASWAQAIGFLFSPPQVFADGCLQFARVLRQPRM
jgi:hypothetical protein